MDNNDWVTISNLIDIIQNRWGKLTIDIFAFDKNRKSKRFNSRYLCPEAERLNAFSLDRSNEFNLLVPSVYKTMHHFIASSSEARAALACPCWPSARFWSLLHKKVKELHEFVGDSFTLKGRKNYIKLEEKSEVFYRFKKFQGWILSFSPYNWIKILQITIITLPLPLSLPLY